ncbi:MAG: hypothetical protein N2116_07420, partial [Armatimonadetes bacterium]|nr:hypothetical protein [Armatimonadota bacterium]
TNEAIQQVSDTTKEQTRLREICENFEAFLVSYLLRQMWQAAESIGEEKPFMSQAYKEMFTFEFAKLLTPSLRLGIAEMMYRELSWSVSSNAPKLNLSDGDTIAKPRSS